MPLIDGVVVDEDGFDLYSPKEALILDSTIVNVECDERFLRCDVAMTHISHLIGERVEERLTRTPHVSKQDCELIIDQTWCWVMPC